MRFEGRQVTYGTYNSEEEAVTAQACWRLTHLLPEDDPELVAALPVPAVVSGGVRCDEWFARWQAAKVSPAVAGPGGP